ncbi:MAG TPA: signal peptidase I [Eubacteriales bacterium]|nr:signal peptidase I [Eubacteriales bacterium]
MSGERKQRRSDGRERAYRNARRLGWLFSILAAVAVLCLVFLVWLFPARIVDQSMEPTLTGGEVVLCDRLAKYVSKPERGDIILFKTEDGVFIKRIVGLPGESVEVVGGYVFIDSRPLDESAYASDYAGDMEPVIVPDGEVFVLGDKRSQMYDSRLEAVGCISYENILGELRVRVAPIEKLTFFS